MPLPLLAPIRQIHTPSPIRDLATAVRAQWLGSERLRHLPAGSRIAVGVGSRGIAHVGTIVRVTLESLRELRLEPFVVAAMGSHGGGNPQGQRALLAEYGVSEQALGVPVRTEMETVRLGTNSWGEPVFWDRNAYEADGVVTISRIKLHTDFRGRYESGILKMMVIGLGKRDGAAQHHRWGVRGLRDMMPESAKVVLETTRFQAGLAILENAIEEPAHLQLVDRHELLAVEPGLLERARAMMGRLPFDHLDLLVIGELGKNYSGAGIDPNVVGRLLIEGEPETYQPKITRICVLDVSPESHGNATGVGIADLTTDRLLGQIDPVPFRMNNLTACFLWRSKLPIGFPTDRACIESGIATCWQPIAERLRMAFIPNTLELRDLWVAPALLPECRNRADLQILGEPVPLPFDATDTVEQRRLFPDSVQGKRR